MPSPVEALPCGSRSIISVRQPVAASAVARLIAVVVLPTPPFWFATAILIILFLAFSARYGPARPITGWRHRFSYVPREPDFALAAEIGRTPCRERGCQNG